MHSRANRLFESQLQTNSSKTQMRSNLELASISTITRNSVTERHASMLTDVRSATEHTHNTCAENQASIQILDRQTMGLENLSEKSNCFSCDHTEAVDTSIDLGCTFLLNEIADNSSYVDLPEIVNTSSIHCANKSHCVALRENSETRPDFTVRSHLTEPSISEHHCTVESRLSEHSKSFEADVTLDQDVSTSKVIHDCLKDYIPLNTVYEEISLLEHTPVKWFRLAAYLDGYDPVLKTKVLNNIKDGVSLNCSLIDDNLHSDIYNHPSAIENRTAVSEKLAKELSQNRIAGPFKEKPEGLLLSPLAAVPKKNSNSIRLIHDLSHPRSSNINNHIPREYSKVNYETLDDCLKIISTLGCGALIGKSDVSSAFRILPVCKYDYRLLGFHWDGNFYFETVLPMGASPSCALFEQFSTSLQWILQNKFNVKFVSHIIDDFLFFGPSNSSSCYNSLQSFFALCESVGVPLNHEKTVMPTTQAELHGIKVDTMSMTMSLPDDKVTKARVLIDQLISCQKAPIKQVQELIGFLNFCCKVVPVGRAFLRRLIDLIKGNKPKWFKVRITRPVRDDLSVWLHFLDNYNGKTIISSKMWCEDQQWHIYTDACKIGFSGVFGTHWFVGIFPPDWLKRNIAIKEFIPFFIALQLWKDDLSNTSVLFHIDNQSVVCNLSSLTSKLPAIMEMLRPAILFSLEHNIYFYATYIRSKANRIADLISRLQIARARECFPQLDQYPTQFNQNWLPWSKSPRN